MSHTTTILRILTGLLLAASLHAASTVPTDIRMPGTQPGEVPAFDPPSDCAGCHAGYNAGEPQHEPFTGWSGGAMANAGRDPIFWAALAISEQDFDGSGDLCIRCHSTAGWYGDRSIPTDGSGLDPTDDDGVDCIACHSMTNPDNTEHLGVMNSHFTANCSNDPIDPDGTCESTSEGYYGGGMLSLSDSGETLGPYTYDDGEVNPPPHDYAPSGFHRDVDFCGSCHDISNPLVGDLASNNGAQTGAPAVVASGVPDDNEQNKAAFNNPPFAYGIIGRTFSEYKASAYPTTLVSQFHTLPADLRVSGGALDATYQASVVAAAEAQANDGNAGDYADGTPRFFSCQSCHMSPVESAGASKKNLKIRKDLPSHDHTGANYWFADITRYQDDKGTLLLGGGLTADQIAALELGQQRAKGHLQQAASLQVSGNTLKVINLAGHKLGSGYPEGGRMWINIKWYDDTDTLLREDGKYGPIGATVSNPSGGPDVQVESILDLDGTNTRIYEAHYAVTRDWAATIRDLHGADFALSYDRLSGDVTCTVGDFLLDDNATGKKDACKGDFHNTFHFTLNNHVSADNRIPPYMMSFDIAQKRNALPVPSNQYGGGTSGSTYNYWDEITLNPPGNADHARIELLYQGTSWEYIQFLRLANNGQNTRLGQEGIKLLDAWLNAPTSMDPAKRTMVAPIVMASTEDWVPGQVNEPPTCSIDDLPGEVEIQPGESVSYSGTVSDSDGTVASYTWNFPGGTPASASVEDPGAVVYNLAGTYTTTFSAEDDAGDSCTPDSIKVTVSEPGSFSIGGNVSGLAASGLVLQNNDTDDLTVSANGGFAFATELTDGSTYKVTVKTQPTSPNQTCTVANGSGILAGADVTDVNVSCSSSPNILYQLSVTSTGLGIVTSAPAGIDCRNDTCQADFTAGSNVILSGNLDSWVQGGLTWAGACSGSNPECDINMTAPKSVSLVFDCDLMSVPEPLAPVTDQPPPLECFDLRAVDGYAIGAGGVVVFSAQNAITLGPGFKVAAGGVFHAVIVP